MAIEQANISVKNRRDIAEVLTGAKYCLMAFKEERISEKYITWLNDPEVNRFTEFRFSHQSYETALEFVSSFYGKTEKYMWGIYPRRTSAPIGTATLHTINRQHGCGEIGLLIGEKDYWGKEASSEAIKLILQFAFDVLGLRRVTGGTYSCNRGMNFTYKMLGFRREGVLKKACATDPGVYVDVYRWAILADEWKAWQKSRSKSERMI